MPDASGASLPEVGAPALLVRTGSPIWDYGALATARTLGRWGIPVYVLAAERETELLQSRYVTARVADPLPADEGHAEVLNGIAARIGTRCVVLAGDDESAVTLAQSRDDLDPRLLTFPVPPTLPLQLSDKVRLGTLAAQAGIGYPRWIHTADRQRLRAFVADVGLPVIAKSPAPYSRLADQTVPHTTLIHDQARLAGLLAAAESGQSIFLQEFLAGDGEFWYAAGVVARAETDAIVWTGRKYMAHPSDTGIGIVNVARPASDLVELMRRTCQAVGYVGPFDSDWVRDHATRQWRLIDFNPRRGAQFRLFTTTTGLDVVRASHLALTGRRVDPGEQIMDRVQVVENLAIRHGWSARPRRYAPGATVEYAWWAADDIGPATAMAGQVAAAGARRVMPGRRGRS
ncbi:MAG: hypothetical protein V9G10_17080 [Candidatus Nanopelagicales bacterium]